MSDTSLHDCSILIGTCFLLDANSQPNRFGRLITKLKYNNCDFVTLYPVRTEFVRTKSLKDLKAKIAYYEEIMDSTLTVDKTTEDLIDGVIEEYGKDLPGVSAIDLYLAATLKRYKHGLYLLTSNHRDFPTSIFTRIHIEIIEEAKTIKSFAFYQYKPF